MGGALSTSPTAALVVFGGIFLLVGAILAVALTVSPESRRQLAYLRERSGVGPVVGTAIAVAFFASLASVFALGGTTTGRTDYPLAGAALAHLVGLFALGVAVAALSDDRLLAGTAEVDTGAVGPGRVVVTGVVATPTGPLRAPFSGTDAVCWECWVTEREVRADGPDVRAESVGVESNWTVEYGDEARTRFRVDDGSGPVAVDPRGADLDLGEDREWHVPFGEDPPARILAFVEDDLARVGYAANDRRYEEALLAPGDEVTVVGTVVGGERRAAGGGAGDVPRSTNGTADDAASGDGPELPVVDGAAGDCIVAVGSIETVRSGLRRRYRSSGGVGVALSALGYAGMLAAAGVV